MNTNYQLKLDNIIDDLENQGWVPTLLLHSCCAPCSSYVLEYLSNYFKITILYYNPNIYPQSEFDRRYDEQKEFINKLNTKYPIEVIRGNYDVNYFLDAIKDLENVKEGGIRCFKCYHLRLEETAKIAKSLNFDYFTTTLSISPYKNSNKLNEIGELLANTYNIKYLYADFKKKNGYKRSIELSKIYNLYRQDYCGCQFSLEESKKRKLNKEQYDG